MRMLDIQILPLIGPEQTVDQVIVHVIDVTERLQLEALVIQNEHFAARGRLAATVAHEVNTPLQSIRNCLYLAGKAQGQQRDTYLELASEELERISTIVRKLLDVKHHGDESTPALINLNTLIERVLLLTGGTLASYGIDIERNFSPTRPMVFGYANHLTQVLLNIILNAVDAMPDGGKLYLNTRSDTLKPETSRQPAFQSNTGGFSATLDAIESVQPAGGQDIVMIEITDTGCGIPPEIQSRMFDPFFTTKASGSGVGLAISQQIVVQHGGQINVHSTPGHGSTFRIILPSGSLTAASPTSGEDEDKENPG
jgi:two-component system NtrC family sensor kinase